MGASTKKTNTKSTQNTSFNNTTTPNNPEWLTKGLEGLGSQITALGNADPYSFVAGPDALQTQAAGMAAGLKSSPLYKTAGDLLSGLTGKGPNTAAVNTYDPTKLGASSGISASQIDPVERVQGQSLLDGLENYYNPFEQRVIDTSLADFDQDAGRTRAQLSLDGANLDDTFGGSGGAITQSLTEGELARARGALDSGLRYQGFNTATSLSGQDADRRQSAALANAGAANMRSTNQAGLNQGADTFNAGERNRFTLQQGLLDQQASSENTDALNTGARFNAGQADVASARDLAAANSLGSLATAQGNDERANIGTQADIGSMLQQLSQAKAGSPLALLAAQAGLWGSAPFGMLSGSTQNGTGTATGNSTSKSSGADLSDWLGLASSVFAPVPKPK